MFAAHELGYNTTMGELINPVALLPEHVRAELRERFQRATAKALENLRRFEEESRKVNIVIGSEHGGQYA